MVTDLAALARAALIGELAQQRDAVRALAEPLSERQFRTRPTEPGNSFGHGRFGRDPGCRGGGHDSGTASLASAVRRGVPAG